MANEQVSVRFVADINAYVKNVKIAQDTLEKYGLTADKTMIKQIQGQSKVVQSQAQITMSTARVATETAKMERAQAQAALAQEKLAQQTERGNMANNAAVDAIRRVVGQYLSIAAVIGTIKKVVGEGMDFNKFVETSTAAFGVMMKSTDAAKAKMQELYDWAVKSPLTFKETVAASKQLLAYGFGADKLVSTMETLGTVSKATGHSLDDIAYVYGTLKTQGRAYTRDLMQFAMRGIPIYDELAKVLGRPKEEIQKLTEAGKVGFKEVEQAFKNMTTNGGVYAGFLQEYMKTLEGKLSMLTDVWQKSAGLLTQGLSEELKPVVEDLTKALSDNADEFKKWGSAIGEAFAIVIDVVKNLGILAEGIVYVGKILISDLIKPFTWFANQAQWVKDIVGGVATALLALIPGVGPWLAISAAITKIITSIRQYREVTGDIVAPTNIENIGASHWKRTQMAKVTSAKTELAGTIDKEAWENALKEFEKYKDAYDKWQAGRSSDIYAMIDYEYKKNLELLEEKLGAYPKLLIEAKKYITEEYAYEREQIRKNAWENALNAFEKYKDAYEKWQAEKSDNIYATIDYEYKKNIELVEEKLGAYPKLLSTAKAYITEEYAYEREQIRKNAQEKQTQASIQGLNALVPDYILNPEGLTIDKLAELDGAYGNIIERIIDYNDTLGDAEKQNAAYAQAYKRALDAVREFEPKIPAAQAKAFEKEFSSLEGVEADPYAALLIQYKDYQSELDKLTLIGDEARAEFKLNIDKWYFDERTKLDIESAKKVQDFIDFWRNRNLATYKNVIGGSSKIWEDLQAKAGEQFEYGNWMKGYGISALAGLQGTGVGRLVEGYMGRKEGAGMGTGLNVFMTALQAAGGVLSMVVKFIVDIVKQSKPMTDLLDAITASVSGALMPVINSLAEGLSWLYDNVVVPVGNGILEMANMLIRGINNTFGKWMGFKINEFDMLKTTTEALKEMADAAVSTEALTQTIDYLQEKLDDMVNSQIESLQDLYEVGAISAQEYEMQSKAIYKQYETDKKLVSVADRQLATLGGIYSRLSELLIVQQIIEDESLSNSDTMALLKSMNIASSGATATISQSLYDTLNKYGIDMSKYTATPTTSAFTMDSGLQAYLNSKFSSLAVGTNYVPQNMPANIHKGEMIIPSDFSSAIRRGDLTLGSGSSSGGNINVTVNVEGSVQTENKLAASIANAIYRQRRSGVLTV